VDHAGVVAFASGLLALLASLILLVVRRRWRLLVVTVATAALALVTAALAAYVFTAEGYTNTGRTVWEDSNGPRQVLELVAIALTAATVVLAGMSRRRVDLTGWVPAAALIAVIVDYVTLVSTVE
jgi:hypothetical protein